MNEGEVASEYVYKKAQGKANATSQSFMNDGQILEKGVKYNQETINESTRTNTNGTNDRGLATNRSSITEDNEGISRAYTRGSYNGTRSWLVEGTHTLPQDIKNVLEQEGYSTPDFHELKAGDEGMANIFFNALAKAKELNPKIMAAVDLHEATEYKDMKLFLTDDENCGFAIKPDGDLISVFSYPKGSGRNKALMTLALQQGATKLDCYDVGLPKIYKRFGFVEVDRVKWNEEYKPNDWDKEHFKNFNNGEPDVVYMQLRQTPPAPVEPQQLKLDFSQAVETKQSTNDIVSGIINGDVAPTTKADIETIVSKVEQLKPEISGFKWKDVIENPEKYAQKIEELFTEEDTSGLIEALAKGDIDSLETIVKKEAAAVKIVGELSNVIKTKGLNLDEDAQIAVIDSIHHLANYIKGIKSGFGTGLQAQKGINEVLESYGASRLSSWTKEGIDVFASKMVDKLNDIISLNFTRGEKLTPLQVKQQLANALFNDPETHNFMAFLAQNKDISTAFTSEIEKIFNKKGTITAEDGVKVLRKILMLPEYKAQVKAAQLAPDKKSFYKTITEWCDKQGGITSYYVHNLLSGVGSLAKNIGSGAINTIYFPARKILASYDPFIDQQTRENLVKKVIEPINVCFKAGKKAGN